MIPIKQLSFNDQQCYFRKKNEHRNLAELWLELFFCGRYYCRGANNITETPIKQIPAPTQSYKSGVFLSMPQPIGKCY